MAKRELKKMTKVERMFKILEYLKWNTDREHPIKQSEMRRDSTISEYLGDKETFNRLIKDLAGAMNSGEFGYKQEEEWKLYFRDFKRYYDEQEAEWNGDEEGDDEEEEYTRRSMRIQGLYYNRTFSYEEINSLIEGVLASRTLDTRTAGALIEKIEKNLTTKFYKKGPQQIFKIREPQLADRKLLRENLLMIQKAIDHDVRISFHFNGYTCEKKLERVGEEKYEVSPYYIVVSGGRYYLFACMEIQRKGKALKNMSIWRIDLMTDMEIPNAKDELGIYGLPRVPKREVENLPQEWNEDFQLKHLNMSFDKPEMITLRIKSRKKEGDPTKRERPDYTFLYDWFGNNFRYIRTEKEAPYDDIVRVECSPYGMVNWALQYSDRVEVLAPESVRERVIEKIRNLKGKYGVE